MVRRAIGAGEPKSTAGLADASGQLGGQPNLTERQAGDQYRVNRSSEWATRSWRRCRSGVIKLVKVDAQGYDHFVVNGLRDSLLRNPDAVSGG